MTFQVTPCALIQSFVHCFFLFFSMMIFQHGASLLWRCVPFLCRNHYCVMLFLRFILPWYSLYFWLCIQGIHPTIKGEVWEFLLGCYDPKSTTEQRNQLRQQRRFFCYFFFVLTMQFFSCLKSISFYCSISFCITKERQVPIFVKKKLWQMVLCSMAHCFILRNFSIALCSSLIIKVYLHIICYGIRNITICIFL